MEGDLVPKAQSDRRTSRWAVIIFVAAIAAAASFFLVVPAVLVFLGAMAIRGHLGGRMDLAGRGWASAAATISGLAVIVGLGMVILVAVGRERDGHRGAICAANIRGIMQSMVVYANDNNECYPMVAYAPYASVPNAPNGLSTGKRDASAEMLDSPRQAGNVQALMWVLVAYGQVAPKQFICPNDPFTDRTVATAYDAAGNLYDNFQTPKQLSYSIAYPWNAKGEPGAWWRNTVDAGIPIIADMTPMQGTGTPTRNLTPARAPADNRTWNSGNHGGAGQFVGNADAHGEFCRTPTVGPKNDNIYTMSGSPSTGPAEFGGIPAGKAVPLLTDPSDVIMLPVRNLTTGGM